MGKSTNINQTTAKTRDQQAIAGIAKYLVSVPKITLDGTDYTAATLTTALQSEVSSIMALASAKAQLAKQVADNRNLNTETQSIRTALRGYLIATYGASAIQILGDFGMKTPKLPGPKTAEAKAQSAAKAVATRKARRAAVKNAVVPAATTTTGK